MPKPITSCRLCGSTALESVLSLGKQALTGVFPRSATEQPTIGPLELVKCQGACSLLQLAHEYESSEMYGANYGYRSGLNRSMVEHLHEKVRKLRQWVEPFEGDVVLDIGSNDGTLLRAYPEGPRLIGIDPTAAKFREFYEDRVTVVPDFFSAARYREVAGGVRARLITSVAMLYDLSEPLGFVEQIAQVLASDGLWHFEQSYMPAMLKVNAYDTVCHEHVEYYGLRQIQWMLERCGLHILDVEINDVNGGSFAVTAAHRSAPFRPHAARVAGLLAEEEVAGLDGLAPYREFAARVASHRDALRERVAEIHAAGRQVLGYGASTKGNVLLQYCGFTPADIPAIAEVNPDKFGAFTPGTAIPIISENEAHDRNPEYLLVLPWHFRENLLARERAYLDRGGRMLFPLPRIEVVCR